jgi:hypothetical protein
MESLLLDDVGYTDYGQFDLVWSDDGGFDGNGDRFFAKQINGLVGAADPHGVYIHLARRSGGSRVRIVLLPGPPTALDERYEDVVEVSTTVPDGATPRLMSWASETSEAMPQLTPGTYRLRVSAYGRDAGHQQEFAPGIVDEYLVQVWAADLAPDEILRSGSQDAAYRHEQMGGPR